MTTPTPTPIPAPDPRRAARSGFLACLGAYGLWGVSAIFFKALAAVPPQEVIAHRVVWGLLVLAVAVGLLGLGRPALAILASPRKLPVYAASALFVSVNWLTFVHAAGSGRALEASLGYYILPLVTVALGTLVLKERFTRRHALAVALAGAGVAVLVIHQGAVPWIALILAVSFAVYGLLRKIAPADSLVGLFVETLLLAPFALAYIVWAEASGQGAFLPALGGGGEAGGAGGVGGMMNVALLLAVGTPLWTALPLFLFGYGARRLNLTTVGLMQYLNPTLQFAVATALFGEPFGAVHLGAFALIWLGLGVFSWSALSPGLFPGSGRNSVLAKERDPGDH